VAPGRPIAMPGNHIRMQRRGLHEADRNAAEREPQKVACEKVLFAVEAAMRTNAFACLRRLKTPYLLGAARETLK
jgi:hypothetical protein